MSATTLSIESLRQSNTENWIGGSESTLRESVEFGGHSILWLTTSNGRLHGVILVDSHDTILRGVWNKHADILYFNLQWLVENSAHIPTANSVINIINKWVF